MSGDAWTGAGEGVSLWTLLLRSGGCSYMNIHTCKGVGQERFPHAKHDTRLTIRV
jgi:hypothetical protein